MTVQCKIPGWKIHSADEVSHPQVNLTINSHSSIKNILLFKDGSHTNTGIGAAFSATEGRDYSVILPTG